MAYKDPEKRRAYDRAHREERLAWKRAWQEAHREELRAACRVYRKTHLEECRATDRAYQAEHRDEMAAYFRLWSESHQAERRAARRMWAKDHPLQVAEKTRRHRALKRGATIGPIDLEAIKVRDRMTCCICGKKVSERDFSLDHTIPLALGGSHSQENLRVAHLRCNQLKGAGRLPVQMVLL